ncbi:MAG TPA: hypothetical protein VIL74_23185 [Pyrinomonadaceae bacterium]
MFAACETTGNENSTANRNAAAPTANETGRKAADEANSKAGGNSNSPGNSAESPDFMGTAGITEKKYEIKNAAILEDVRAGRHEGFDRVVFEFEDAEMPSYHVEYIDAPVRACGSGNVVSLKGDGFLEIRFTPANAHTEDGEPTVKNREQWPNLKIIKEIKSTCDFEAEVEWVLGVAAANKYRVLELKNPTRLAIDIKH